MFISSLMLNGFNIKPTAIQSLLFERENLKLALKDFSNLYDGTLDKKNRKVLDHKITNVSARLTELDRVFSIINLKIENT